MSLLTGQKVNLLTNIRKEPFTNGKLLLLVYHCKKLKLTTEKHS